MTMTADPIIREVEIISEDDYQSSKSDMASDILILVKKDRPVGITNNSGQLTFPLFIGQFENEKDLIKILSVAQDRLFKYPFVPGIVIINNNGEIEGIIDRDTVADKFDALLERSATQGLAGAPKNVPIVIYQCPEGDYEFIPFEGPPDHLCPVHNLRLEPKRIIVNV